MSQLSLQEMEAIVGKREFQSMLRRIQLRDGGTYAEFVDLLYQDVDGVIFELQKSPNLLQQDTEDRLTQDFVVVLNRQGYHASHDSMAGGHVDLSVKLGKFSWIAEAKKDGSFDEALRQLTTRYVQASGNFAHDHAGLIFYLVKTADAMGSLTRWKAKVRADGCLWQDCKLNNLAFYSTHRLPSSGTDITVRTMAVALFHRPQDRSGLATAAKRVKRSDG